MTDFEYVWGPWNGFSYQKVHWFYNHKDWTAHFKHFLVLGWFYAKWSSSEHEVRQ